jgi:hypothetical protein
VFAIASREAMFGTELESLRRIEGTKRLSVEVVKVPR